MIDFRPVKSPAITTIIIISSISCIYYLLLESFISFAPCVQKNTPTFSFDLLFKCADYAEKLTFLYLGICLLGLFKIKLTNILNLNGLRLSRIIVLIILVSLLVLYIFKLL